jgi:UDP-N-acetylglucosamine enolpyruvyl transferase
MASFTNDLRLKEIGTGDEDGTWGTSTNTNLALIADAFSLGTKNMAADANETFTIPDASADDTRSLYLKITSAVSLTATRTVTLAPNTVSKVWIIENATTGSQIITIAQGSGATINVPSGNKVVIDRKSTRLNSSHHG